MVFKFKNKQTPATPATPAAQTQSINTAEQGTRALNFSLQASQQNAVGAPTAGVAKTPALFSPVNTTVSAPVATPVLAQTPVSNPALVNTASLAGLKGTPLFAKTEQPTGSADTTGSSAFIEGAADFYNFDSMADGLDPQEVAEFQQAANALHAAFPDFVRAKEQLAYCVGLIKSKPHLDVFINDDLARDVVNAVRGAYEQQFAKKAERKAKVTTKKLEMSAMDDMFKEMAG